MVFRILMQLISNNEKLIQQLSESYPVRRAAQLVVLFFHRGKGLIEDQKLNEKLTPEQFRSFINRFARNMRDEMKRVQEKSKKQN